MVMAQPLLGRTMVHVVNYSGQRNGLYTEPAKIQGLRVAVREDTATALALVAGTTLKAGPVDGDGYRWFDLPPVGYFEALSIGGYEAHQPT